MDSLDPSKNSRKEREFNLDRLMGRVFWRDILEELTSDMNPWDINLVELADRYSKKVEKMKELDFKIPANVILVSSILLRMKSDLLAFSGPDLEYDLEEWVSEGSFLEEFSVFPDLAEKTTQLTDLDIDEEIPIKVKPKRITKRRITANELIAAISEVLEEKERDKKIKEEGRKDLVVENEFDIKKLINETYLRVMEILMRKQEARFSELAQNKEEKINILLSLLHLVSNKKLILQQSRFYEEIFIRVFSSQKKS